MTPLINGVGLIMFIGGFAVFARAILSWFPIDRSGPVVQALDAVTEPILDPLRRVIPPLGMIDLTPMIAMLFLLIVGQKLMDWG